MANNENEIVASEKVGGYHIRYRVIKDPGFPAHPWHLEAQYASGGTWESAMQGHYETEKDALLNFAKRHTGFTETLKDVVTDNQYIKQGIDALFKEQADREAKRLEEERKSKEDWEHKNKYATELGERFVKVHFKSEKTKIAGEKEGAALPDEVGLTLNGLTITDNKSSGKWKKYNITHQQSGLLVADEFASLKDAKIAAWRLTQVMDWDRPKEAVIKDLPKGLKLFMKQMREDPYVEYPEELRESLGKSTVIKQSAVVTPKEPWQMTREEWDRAKGKLTGYTKDIKELERLNCGISKPKNIVYHKDVISQALSEGKPVPPEVLKDYPELVRGAKYEQTIKAVSGLRESLEKASENRVKLWENDWINAEKSGALGGNAYASKLKELEHDIKMPVATEADIKLRNDLTEYRDWLLKKSGVKPVVEAPSIMPSGGGAYISPELTTKYPELEAAVIKRGKLWDAKVLRESKGGTGERLTKQWEQADLEVRRLLKEAQTAPVVEAPKQEDRYWSPAHGVDPNKRHTKAELDKVANELRPYVGKKVAIWGGGGAPESSATLTNVKVTSGTDKKGTYYSLEASFSDANKEVFSWWKEGKGTLGLGSWQVKVDRQKTEQGGQPESRSPHKAEVAGSTPAPAPKLPRPFAEMIRKVQQNRTPRAVAMDKKRKAVTVKGKGRAKWLKRPNRYDIKGIDTPKQLQGRG